MIHPIALTLNVLQELLQIQLSLASVVVYFGLVRVQTEEQALHVLQVEQRIQKPTVPAVRQSEIMEKMKHGRTVLIAHQEITAQLRRQLLARQTDQHLHGHAREQMEALMLHVLQQENQQTK